MRQRFLPPTGGNRQGLPLRVRAAQRGLCRGRRAGAVSVISEAPEIAPGIWMASRHALSVAVRFVAVRPVDVRSVGVRFVTVRPVAFPMAFSLAFPVAFSLAVYPASVCRPYRL